MKAVVVGRFPPPLDGQSIATARLRDLLAGEMAVEAVDILPHDAADRHDTGITWTRILHSMRLRGTLKKMLPSDTETAAIWPAVSPDVSGHFRDMLIVLPHLRKYRRLIAVVHRGNFDKLFRSPLTSKTGRSLVRGVSTFVFLTRNLSDRCSDWIPTSKRVVIPNTIDDDVRFDLEEVTTLRKRHKTGSDFRVLFLSNMIYSKGYHDVLEAVSMLHANGRPVTARFVGAWHDESHRRAFERHIAEAGLGGVAEHLGAIHDRARIKEMYAEASVLVLPSYYTNEAQPLAIIEALNAGLPVIATRHGGIAEMIDDGIEGFLVPAKDPKSIASAIRTLIEDGAWAEMSVNARHRFETEFAAERVLARWMALLHP